MKKTPIKKTSGSSFLAAQGFLNGDGSLKVKPQIVAVEVDKPKACHLCGGSEFWKNNAGEWICDICHPTYKEDRVYPTFDNGKVSITI